MKVQHLIRATPHLVKLVMSLFFMWLELGWTVRKARKALEEELLKSGMPKSAAEKLGKEYASVKDQMISQVWCAAISQGATTNMLSLHKLEEKIDL